MGRYVTRGIQIQLHLRRIGYRYACVSYPPRYLVSRHSSLDREAEIENGRNRDIDRAAFGCDAPRGAGWVCIESPYIESYI